MTIQSLLNEGRVQRTGLEIVADAMLLLPRVLWKGRNVQVLSGPFLSIKDEEYVNWSTKYVNFVKGVRDNYSSVILLIPCSIFFAVFNLIATPLLALGLSLKQISLAYDPKARAYHAIVVNQLKLGGLAQKKKVLEEELAKVEPIVNKALDKFERERPSESDLARSRVIQKINLVEPKETEEELIELSKAYVAIRYNVYLELGVNDLISKVKTKHRLKNIIEKLAKSIPETQKQLKESLQIFSSVTRSSNC